MQKRTKNEILVAIAKVMFLDAQVILLILPLVLKANITLNVKGIDS